MALYDLENVLLTAITLISLFVFFNIRIYFLKLSMLFICLLTKKYFFIVENIKDINLSKIKPNRKFIFIQKSN